MRLLVALKRCAGYFRFVAPVLAELEEEFEIVLVSSDADEFFGHWSKVPYTFQEPVKPMGPTTELFRQEYRGKMAYLYWALLGVQTPQALERAMGRKYVPEVSLRRGVSWIAHLLARTGYNRGLARRVLYAVRMVEKVIVDKAVLAHVKAIAPDVVLNTPGLYPHGWEIEYIKAARRLGIPTLTLIASWDHLSGKGWLTVVPDRVLIWNQMQFREAVEYHSVKADQLAVVGSPSFDWLFDERYMQSRTDFCRQARLDPERPFILWAASAPGNCMDEPGVVRMLMQEMRKYPILKDYQVLIRPHPSIASKYVTDWTDWQNADTPVWSSPTFPTGEEDKQGLFNSIAHAAAVLGLSTSVFLEAGILDRPVALLRTSVSASDAVFNKSMHFKFLLENHFPEATDSEADCARWLAEIASGNDAGREARRWFISWFLRPQGMNLPSAKMAAEAITELAGKR